jgi:starch synthase
MRVVMLASEARPYATTGGLGDVLAALPRALVHAGVEVQLCLPAYRSALRAAGRLAPATALHAPVGSRMEPVEIVAVADAPVPTALVRADRFFDRDGLYGPPGGGDYPDNAERFVVFCRAALEWLRRLAPPPDVLHVHDWQAALVPALLRGTAPLYPELARVRTLLTIHNLAYQGRFPASTWPLLNLDLRYFTPPFLEFWGDVSFLKAGIVFADAITTVSPRYAAEIETPAHGAGLDGVLRTRHADLHGILNGIDDVEWNPATDPHLPAHYDVADPAGKARCKAALQRELGLAVDPAPALLGVVSRLVEQKGVDLLVAAGAVLLAGGRVQLAVLGSGNARDEAIVRGLGRDFPGRAAVRIGFDEGLAHRIEAGADVFLMPSRYEPCGLNQLYSLRYGTVPVVHATGGLDDSVEEFDPAHGTGTGFKFTSYTTEAFVAAIERALRARRDRTRWAGLVRNGMRGDFSWGRAAREYVRVYRTLPAPRVLPPPS